MVTPVSEMVVLVPSSSSQQPSGHTAEHVRRDPRDSGEELCGSMSQAWMALPPGNSKTESNGHPSTSMVRATRAESTRKTTTMCISACVRAKKGVRKIPVTKGATVESCRGKVATSCVVHGMCVWRPPHQANLQETLLKKLKPNTTVSCVSGMSGTQQMPHT